MFSPAQTILQVVRKEVEKRPVDLGRLLGKVGGVVVTCFNKESLLSRKICRQFEGLSRFLCALLLYPSNDQASASAESAKAKFGSAATAFASN